MNDLDRIYQELGEGICLFPFIGAFYSTVETVDPGTKSIPNSIRPCSLVRWEGRESPWWIDPELSLMENRNTDYWKNMRQQFLEGNWKELSDCTTCINSERLGGDSPRINNNQLLAETVSEDIVALVKKIQNNNYVSDSLKMLEYFPSNYCNFECTICSSGSSTARNVFERKYLDNDIRILVNSADPDFLEIVNDLEILGFAGGETVMQPEVHQIIDYLVENDLAKKIEITVLTNASVYPIKLVDKFKHFKRVLYTVSLDGIGEVIEYQRRGAVWNEMEEVVRQIHANADIQEIVNFVVTSMNILNAMDFVDWCHDNDLRFFTISPVFRKEYLGPSSMPPEIRKVALQRLQDGRSRYEHYPEHEEEYNYVRIIDQLIENIKTNLFDPEDLEKFIAHIRNENKASKKAFHEVVPEWAPYFPDIIATD